MPFVEADYEKEKAMLEKLINENEDIRKAHEMHEEEWKRLLKQVRKTT